MKNNLHSPLLSQINFSGKTNKALFVLLLSFGFLLTSNLAHAQLPQFEDFEGGYGTWNDGGSDAAWVGSTLLNGSRNVQLRDNSGISSSIYSNNINLTSYNSVTIEFLFYADSMESGENFFVEYDDGSGVYAVIGDYVRGTDFNNNTTYSESITITSGSYTFSTNSRFRIRCDASGNGDYVYVDDINITGVVASYCIPNGTNSSYYIDDFSTSGGVTNITNNNTGYSTNGYGDYTSLSVSQYSGSSIDFYGNFTDGSWSSSGFGVGVWVDFNDDGDFNDSGETLFNDGYYDPVNDSFTIPVATPPGDYRMRILADWYDSTPSSCNNSFIGEAEDYTLTVLSLPPCSQPSNQPTNLTFSNVYDTSIEGSFTVATSAPDSYLVLYSTNSTPPTISDGTTYNTGSSFSGYTVLSNNSSTTFSATGLTSGSIYFFFVYSYNENCIGGPNYLNTNPLTGNETTDVYCIPTSTNTSRYIDDFSTTGGITNITNNNTGHSSSGYGNFTNLSASQYAGSTLDFYINTNGNHGFAIWVDFNDDGDFFDTGEEVYNSVASIDPANASFIIPAAAPLGNHRMRILADRNSSSPYSPCAYSGTGETEDYTLTVIAPPPCTEPTNQPTNLVFSNVDQNSLDGSFTAATSSPDSYLVVYSTSNTPPTINDFTTYTIGSSFSDYTIADNDSDTTFSVTGLTFDTTYYFYIYAFNEACIGGPDYLSTSPLTGDETTEWYCIPSSSNSSRYIDDFYTNGGEDNISNLNSGFSAGGYGDYTSLFVSQYANSSVNFSANFDGGTFGFGIWVDFNNDGDFTDTGERVYLSGFYGDPINSSFTIPAATALGNYRMRIVADWNDTTPSPCSFSSSGGEAEDYTLIVIAPCTPSTALGTSDLGCPFVQLGGLGLGSTAPPPVACSIPETTLEATYLELGDTSSYSVESIPYSPPFQFSCLANPVSVNQDDVWSDEINLPFDFCFYGDTYSSVVIGSNGAISFDAARLANGPAGWFTSRDIPNTVNAEATGGNRIFFGPSIFGVHHDVDPSMGGEIGYQLITLDSGCQALVAAWSDVPMYLDNSILYSGMIVFYENTNIIEVYVKEKNLDGGSPWNAGNASIGLQKNSSTATVAPGRNTLSPNWTATNEAWRFVPDGTSITDLKWYENAIAPGNVIPGTDNINEIVVTPTTTTTYFAEVTYTLCDGSTIVETNDTTVTIEGQKTWNGSQGTAWEDPNNWTPVGVPVSTDCILIPFTVNHPIMASTTDGSGYNLEIENGAILTQKSNSTLTIEDAITIESAGVFDVENSASLIQITDVDVNKNTGTAKVQRSVSGVGNYDYVYWSSPVELFDVEDISPNTPSYGIYKWEPTVANGTSGQHGNWVTTAEDMALGKGYIVRGLVGTPTANTAEFSGKLNNGKITYPISRGTYTGGTYEGVANTSTAEDDNWNLLGNPYPSAILLEKFVLANPAIDGTLYFWRHLTALDTGLDNPFYEGFTYNYKPSDYMSANSLGSSPAGFNDYIASGQGFFALMLDSAPTTSTVTFNNSMRDITYENDVFYRSETSTNEKHRIWLDLVSEDNIALSTLVGFASGATNGMDRLYDGLLLNQEGNQFYSLLSDKKLTIQGKALPFVDTETVPLGYKSITAGNYTITINQLDGLFDNADQNIYLEDTELNIIHDLRANPYAFTTDEGVFESRFVLRFNNATLSIKDQEVLSNLDIRTFNNTINATSNLSTIETFELHDIAGRLIHKNLKVESTNYSYQSSNLSTGTYVVTVTLTNGATVSKKLII